MKHTGWTTTLFALLLGVGALGCGENLTPAVERELYEPEELEPLPCVPNQDNVITAEELPVADDVPVSYLINPAGSRRAVDLGGQINASGERRWDWSAEAPDDRKLQLSASTLEGKWYADSFPTGQFVSPSDAAGRIMGVYRSDDSGFYLLGLASVEEEPANQKILFVYKEPVALFLFPLEEGRSWVSTGIVEDGIFRGLPYASRDIYEIEVLASGELLLPQLRLQQALQVHTRLTIEPAVGESVVRQQVGYLFECFGEVARATSADNEEEKLFEEAVEVRRLGLAPAPASP